MFYMGEIASHLISTIQRHELRELIPADLGILLAEDLERNVNLNEVDAMEELRAYGWDKAVQLISNHQEVEAGEVVTDVDNPVEVVAGLYAYMAQAFVDENLSAMLSETWDDPMSEEQADLVVDMMTEMEDDDKLATEYQFVDQEDKLMENLSLTAVKQALIEELTYGEDLLLGYLPSDTTYNVFDGWDVTEDKAREWLKPFAIVAPDDPIKAARTTFNLLATAIVEALLTGKIEDTDEPLTPAQQQQAIDIIKASMETK